MRRDLALKIMAAIEPLVPPPVQSVQMTEHDVLAIYNEITSLNDAYYGLTFDLEGYIARNLRYTWGSTGPGPRSDLGVAMVVVLTVTPLPHYVAGP